MRPWSHPIVVALAALTAGSATPVLAAEGWTALTTVEHVAVLNGGVFVDTTLSTWEFSCDNPGEFWWAQDDSPAHRDSYATALTALVTGKPVRIYATDTKHNEPEQSLCLTGKALLLGVELRANP